MRRLRISKDLLIWPCLIYFVAAMARMLRTSTIIAVIVYPPSLDLARRKMPLCVRTINVRTHTSIFPTNISKGVSWSARTSL
ncbi:hypothetical protein F5888DRAFT_1744109, partial [Russula emetica]